MGNSYSISKINYEDIQFTINTNSSIIINTLNNDKQKCLIKGTLSANDEVAVLNKFLNEGNSNKRIIIYGENATDDSIIKKFKQLLSLGFTNIYIYPGGLFEWLLLQDIYGYELFPTTEKEQDILKYKGRKVLELKLIEQ